MFRADDARRRREPTRSFRHEALLWDGPDDFLAATVPFLCDGLAADEAVVIAVTADRADALRDALGVGAQRALFADMHQLGLNPARLIPEWRRVLGEHCGADRPVRGLAEATWSGGRPEEVVEGQLHEALLNVAVDPDTPFWLVCAYDTTRLDARASDEVLRSHPAVVANREYRGSHLYGGRDHVDALWSAELPALPGDPEAMRLTRAALKAVPSFVAAKAYAAGVSSDKSADLAVAVHQLANASLHRNATDAVLRIWNGSDAVVCELTDEIVRSDPLIARKPPMNGQRNSLWAANELCDLVQVRSDDSGTTVRVHTWL